MPTPLGARAVPLCLYFSLSGSFFPSQPHPSPTPARCWDPSHLNNALPFHLPQPFPAIISPAQPCEAEAEHLEQK